MGSDRKNPRSTSCRLLAANSGVEARRTLAIGKQYRVGSADGGQKMPEKI